ARRNAREFYILECRRKLSRGVTAPAYHASVGADGTGMDAAGCNLLIACALIGANAAAVDIGFARIQEIVCAWVGGAGAFVVAIARSALFVSVTALPVRDSNVGYAAIRFLYIRFIDIRLIDIR